MIFRFPGKSSEHGANRDDSHPNISSDPLPKTSVKMAGPLLADRTRKEEYFEILDETIRTNPYRKAATAMASVMSKHGIESNTSNVLGRPMQGKPEKKCALTRALKLAQGCNQKLNLIKEDLQALCSDFGKACPKSSQPTAAAAESDDVSGKTTPVDVNDLTDKATMTGHLLTLIGEAETIAKRIYETAVGLHVAEDYLRQPEDLKLLDFSQNGRIQIPNYNFNHASQLCLEWLHSTAIKWLRGFKEEGDEDHAQFIKIFENFTKAVKDFTEAVCLANQVFRVLLYPNAQGKECLQEYIQAIGHVLKNDIIMEIQTLRRTFDNIQYAFERLGWAASIAWMKYSGKNITVETLNESGIQIDRSRFQYKFYEGPPRTKGKKKETVGNQKKGKLLKTKKLIQPVVKQSNNRNVDSTSAVITPPPESKPSTTTSIPNDSNQENSGNDDENVEGASKLKKISIVNAISKIPRKSRSTPDIFKGKKIVKKKVKAKKTKAKDLLTEEGASANASGESTVGDNRQSFVTMWTNEKPSASSATSLSSKKKKAQALIPPPKIPLALRQQFNAVFGTGLMPMRAVRPLKKKKMTMAMSHGKVDGNRSQ